MRVTVGHRLGLALLLGAVSQTAAAQPAPAPMSAAGSVSVTRPGARVWLDAHNAYPERGRFTERMEQALATGLPVAIEQDLYWARNAVSGRYEAVVAHDDDALRGAPTLAAHFFQRVAPLMEQALRENARATWPLLVLNLDFKTNEPALHDAVWTLLQQHAAWLTTAERTATPDTPAALQVGPLLVLTGQDSTQRQRFHDRVPVGGRLLLFGATPVPEIPGPSARERDARAVRLAPRELMPTAASNYARWVNFPWRVVERGGPTRAGRWTGADSSRLSALVDHAHAQGLWIRFYTLDGYARRARDGAGLSTSYNFGSVSAVETRWDAAVRAGVDFIATDHYSRFRARFPTSNSHP